MQIDLGNVKIQTKVIQKLINKFMLILHLIKVVM